MQSEHPTQRNNGGVMTREVSPDQVEIMVVDIEGNRLMWNLEEEITRVIETGVALGIDFDGKEKAFSEELVRREKEDIERGLWLVEKRKVVRGLVNGTKPMVFFVQETKLSSYDSKIFSSLGGSSLGRGIEVEAKGASGGLLTLWNED
ncbi:hypothetical protein LWI28_007426 [Acer negundo]|uniref:Uncharacterized protein n=1 Tax=Acer negundo TaxID=4023 RepID=A0AAD5JM33_ACENE|nr:hypothetical protein LWI28_007426 [Acer negundo]